MCGIEEDWNFYDVNFEEIEHKSLINFERTVNNINDEIVTLVENYFGHSILHYIGNVKANDGELEELIENNKLLRLEIDRKVEMLKHQQAQYKAIKKDQVLLNKEVKDTHEAFLMAKKYYKKFLRMYYTIESKCKDRQVIFVQFFTETKKESENYSLRLARTGSKGYELLSTTPKLDDLEELQKRLLETKDLPSILANIRLIFLSIKSNHK